MYNRHLNGRLAYLEHDSQLLRGNPLGDPHKRRFPVYLPPDYDSSSQAYPVIIALAGFTGTGLNMPNFSVWEESLPEQLDDLITTEGVPSAILVMPDCMTALGGSQYVNSAAMGPYEDYLVEELIPCVDEQLRADPARRAVIGKSSGGYGALRLAMVWPGTFRAVVSISGDMVFEYGYLSDFPKAINALNEAGGVESFLANFGKARRKGKLIPALNVVAMAAAYSSDEDGIHLPFGLPNGELREDIWDRWLAHDPVRMIEAPAAQNALKDLDLLHIEAGSKDEFALHIGARIFTAKLKALGIDHHYEEFPDGHFGINYRYRVGLEKLGRQLSDNP